MMTYYIAIFVQSDLGEWDVIFPEVPGCEARGFSLDVARYAATSALQQCIRERGPHAASPMDLAGARSEDWLSRNQVDPARAVISMIALAA
jgi:predicted RNase H-like HicB family nuclease